MSIKGGQIFIYFVIMWYNPPTPTSCFVLFCVVYGQAVIWCWFDMSRGVVRFIILSIGTYTILNVLHLLYVELNSRKFLMYAFVQNKNISYNGPMWGKIRSVDLFVCVFIVIFIVIIIATITLTMLLCLWGWIYAVINS